MRKNTLNKKTIRRTHSKTKRFKGGSFSSDNKITTLSFENNPIVCDVCKNTEFQQRDGTIGKSKTNEFITGAILGDTLSGVNDISIRCYFCNNCGNAIFVRYPMAPSEGVYPKLIKSSVDAPV